MYIGGATYVSEKTNRKKIVNIPKVEHFVLEVG